MLGLQMQATAAGTANAIWLLLMGFKVAGSTQAGIQTQWCHTHDTGFSGMKDAGVGGGGSSSVVSESGGVHTVYGGEFPQEGFERPLHESVKMKPLRFHSPFQDVTESVVMRLLLGRAA